MYLIKIRSRWIRVGPNPMTGVFVKRENRQTKVTLEGRPCDHRGRDRKYAAPRIVNNYQKQYGLDDTVISHSSLCDNSLRQPQEADIVLILLNA